MAAETAARVAGLAGTAACGWRVGGGEGGGGEGGGGEGGEGGDEGGGAAARRRRASSSRASSSVTGWAHARDEPRGYMSRGMCPSGEHAEMPPPPFTDVPLTKARGV